MNVDAHHCDTTVQDYFIEDLDVNILSIHEKNRWPRTGHLEECKISNMMNVPVPEKFNDTEMMYVTRKSYIPIWKNLNPDLVIFKLERIVLKMIHNLK